MLPKQIIILTFILCRITFGAFRNLVKFSGVNPRSKGRLKVSQRFPDHQKLTNLVEFAHEIPCLQ